MLLVGAPVSSASDLIPILLGGGAPLLLPWLAAVRQCVACQLNETDGHYYPRGGWGHRRKGKKKRREILGSAKRYYHRPRHRRAATAPHHTAPARVCFRKLSPLSRPGVRVSCARIRVIRCFATKLIKPRSNLYS